jgi:hypothetical protein
MSGYKTKVNPVNEVITYSVEIDNRPVITGIHEKWRADVQAHTLNQETAALREEVARLQAEKEHAVQLLKLLHGMDYTLDALDSLMSDKDYENYAIMLIGIDWINEQVTPAQEATEAKGE